METKIDQAKSAPKRLRHTAGILAIAQRHGALFQKLAAAHALKRAAS